MNNADYAGHDKLVTVVMSVYNNPEDVVKTIDSVLEQKDVAYELLIVDDGAEPAVKKVLDQYSAYPQFNVLVQENKGLTNALRSACASVNSQYIARIDAGDIMRPDRLRKQAAVLVENEEYSLVSSYVDIVTVEGDYLFQHMHSQAQLEAGVKAKSLKNVLTPFHSSVMFRRSAYQIAGGYRSEFYFAQDFDLWSRLVDLGPFSVIEEVLTVGLFSASGLSGRYASMQNALAAIVVQLNRLKESDNENLVSASMANLLKQAKAIRPSINTGKGKETEKHNDQSIAAFYFIAKCLTDNRSSSALRYWRKYIQAKPWQLKAYFFYLKCLLFYSSKR